MKPGLHSVKQGIAGRGSLLAGASLLLVALAQPAGAVQITDFVIYAQQQVTIGVGSQITGLVGSGTAVVADNGDALVGGTAGVFGDVRSRDDVQLNNYAFVTGTVTNPGNLILGGGATVGAHVVAIPDLPNLPAATAYSAGGANIQPGNNPPAPVTLTPGSYGNVILGSNTTLALTAGDYYFSSFSSGHGLRLNADVTGGGNVRIFVVGAINLGDMDVTAIGGNASNIYFETHFSGSNAFYAGGGTDLLGTVFAPYGQIHLGSGSTTGSFQGDLWAGTSVYIEHSVMGSGPPTAAPEPGTVTLVVTGILGLGAYCGLRRRGSRNRSAVSGEHLSPTAPAA